MQCAVGEHWFYPLFLDFAVCGILANIFVEILASFWTFFLFIRFSRTLWQYCVWATCAHPSLSLYFWFKFIFTMLFWFYPYICTVLYVPPPPPISVCSNCMCYSLFLEFGGEMLIDLTLSLCSLTPPPPPPFPEHTWASLLSLNIPSFSRTLCQYLYIFANIFVQYIITFCVRKFLSIFREHYANVWTFLQTFSRSFHHCSMSGFYLPLPVYVNQ
jgi:hypothetical protein